MRPSVLPRVTAATAVAAALFAVVLAPRPAVAQGGATVTGTVTSAESRTPIAGARVSIEQPARRAISDEHGKFTLREVPAGSYTVTITALGREPYRGTVAATAGRTATLDASLKQGSLLLSSVVVSATRTATEANK